MQEAYFFETNQKTEKLTQKRYSFLWKKFRNNSALEEYHYRFMAQVIPVKIASGKIGLDLGCGAGLDTYLLAKENPSIKIIGIDISDGIYEARRISEKLNNVRIVKGSVTRIPLKDNTCDFVYSFGVLHHIHNYKEGLWEIKRVLKNKGSCFLYLYEDHSDNPIKFISLKLASLVRKITIRLPEEIVYGFSYFLSPLLFICFSLPAKFFRRFKCTLNLYEKMPFNFAETPFSLAGDIYDRFSVPVEFRFNKAALLELFKEFAFSNTGITKLEATAGWVVWGRK